MNSRRPVERTVLFIALPLFALLLTGGLLTLCGNNPWPKGLSDSNCMFASMGTALKTLDPSTAYYEHEDAIIASIVEPLFEYHYLKRPYELKPLLATEMPVPQYFGKDGLRLPDDAADGDIGRVEYIVKLRSGVLYQPHPCFAKDASGKHLYIGEEAAIPRCHTPNDFAEKGSREVVAEDFKVAIARLCDPRIASPVYSTFSSFIAGMDACSAELEKLKGEYADYRKVPLEGVQVVDDHTLKIVLKRKYPQALCWMAMHFFAPIPWEALEFYAHPKVQENGISMGNWPVGSGAYMMLVNEPEAKLVLGRNPNYHEDAYPSEGEPSDAENGLLDDAGKRAPFIDTVYYLFEKESIPGWIKFTQGYYDANEIPKDMFDAATTLAADGGMGLSDDMVAKGISLHTAVRLVSYYYAFNMLDSTFGGYDESHRKLRRAVSIAIDSQKFVDIFNNSRGRASQGILPPGIFGGVTTQDNYNSYVFDWKDGAPSLKDIEEAKALMAEAGFPNGIGKDGTRLQLHYDNSSASNPGFKSQFLWLKERLGAIGVELIDNGTDLNRLRDKISTGNWQFTRKGWVADYPDAENFLFLFYSPNAHVPSKGRGPNYTNYMNPEYDAVFTKLEAMPDGPERMQLILQANEILRRDAPCVWDFYPTSFNLTHSWLKNFKPHEVAKNYLRYRRIDIAERESARKAWNRPPKAFVILLWTLVALSGVATLASAAKCLFGTQERSR